MGITARTLWVSVIIASLSCAVGHPLPLHAEPLRPGLIPLTRYAVEGAVAEIISVNARGNLLAYTNAEDRKIGFVSIANLSAPRVLGTVDVAALGEPTSVVITPNGRYAIAAIIANEDKPGMLVFINPTTREIQGQVELQGIGPDSIAITPDGSTLVVAMEDEEDPDNLPGRRPGSINLVTLNYDAPAQSRVVNVAVNLSGVMGVNYVDDPQPEFVAISPDGKTAAITLQENNAIALLDIPTARITRLFSAGISSHSRADLIDDGQVMLIQPVQGRREPDGIVFTPDGQLLITANEGDTDADSFGGTIRSGGRGWSIFDLEGNVVYDSASDLELAAADRNLYPDDRSDDRGIEIEGVAVALIDNRPMVFVASERGNFVAAYDLQDGRNPRLVAIAPTGKSPEGILVIPGRRVLLTANEGDGSISLFRIPVATAPRPGGMRPQPSPPGGAVR